MMEGFECVSMSLSVCRLVQYFLIPEHKGGNQFLSPPASECNTHARTAERLGPDLANTQDELIYQTAASPRHSSDLHRSMPFQRMRDKVGGRESRWGNGVRKEQEKKCRKSFN